MLVVGATALGGCERFTPEQLAWYSMTNISTQVPMSENFVPEATIVRTGDGTIYVAQDYPERVTQIAHDGSHLDIPTPGRVLQLARGGKDVVYAYTPAGIYEISADGKMRLLVGIAPPGGPGGSTQAHPGPQGGPASLRQVYQIAADDAGNVYVMEGGLTSTRVEKIDSTGKVVFASATLQLAVEANNFAHHTFAVDRHGNLYFGMLGGVAMLTADGKVEKYAGAASGNPAESQAGRKRQDISPVTVRELHIDGHDNVYALASSFPAVQGGGILKIPQADGVSFPLKETCPGLRDGFVAAQAAGCKVGLIDGPAEKQMYGLDDFDVDDEGNFYFVDLKYRAVRSLSHDGRLSTIMRGAPAINPYECQGIRGEKIHPLSPFQLRSPLPDCDLSGK